MANQVHIHQDIDFCLQKTNLIVLIIISKWLVYWNGDPSVYRKGYSIMTALEQGGGRNRGKSGTSM